MNKLFKITNIQYQICILTVLIGVFCFLISLSLLSINRVDISLGFLLGTLVFGLISFIQGLCEKFDDNRGGYSMIYSFIGLGLRFALIIGSIVLVGFMNYAWGITYFNLFSFVAVYAIKSFCTFYIYIKDKKEAK